MYQLLLLLMIKTNSSDYVSLTAKEMLQLLIRERLEWDQQLWPWNIGL